MTPERAKELLPVIQAFSEGKEIECRIINSNNKWTVNVAPTWHPQIEYRIAPEKKWYRVALFDGYTITADDIEEEKQTEVSEYFVKWLTPRVYYEVD